MESIPTLVWTLTAIIVLVKSSLRGIPPTGTLTRTLTLEESTKLEQSSLKQRSRATDTEGARVLREGIAKVEEQVQNELNATPNHDLNPIPIPILNPNLNLNPNPNTAAALCPPVTATPTPTL